MFLNNLFQENVNKSTVEFYQTKESKENTLNFQIELLNSENTLRWKKLISDQSSSNLKLLEMELVSLKKSNVILN
jgi:hypothetical protein